MTNRHTRKTNSLMAKAAELAYAVPQVIAHRVTRMAIAGPSLSARDRKEFEGMSSEKTVALSGSWNAMTLEAIRANQTLAASLFRWFWSPWLRGRPSANTVAAQMQSAALGILGKGMAPVHRKAVANAKRLARTRLR